jgi:GT2 family glycosyltransferase
VTADPSRISPLVIVVVVTWNGKNDTLECLESLRAVLYSNFRILLVDNASSDGTVEAVRERFPDVQILRTDRNLRYAGGSNVGIRAAMEQNAKYILLLNNDTLVHPHLLTELVTAAEGDSRVGMVGGMIYYFDERDRIWFAGGKIDWWKGWIAHVGIRQRDSGQFSSQHPTEYITGCCLLVKREVVERIGLLDESYFMYGEDTDWCMRAQRAGYRLLIQPRAKLWHKVSVSSGGHLSWFKNWNKLKSTLRLMRKYARPYHWITASLLLPLMVARGMVESTRKRSR